MFTDSNRYLTGYTKMKKEGARMCALKYMSYRGKNLSPAKRPSGFTSV